VTKGQNWPLDLVKIQLRSPRVGNRVDWQVDIKVQEQLSASIGAFDAFQLVTRTDWNALKYVTRTPHICHTECAC